MRDDDYDKFDVSKMDPFIDMVSKVLRQVDMQLSFVQFSSSMTGQRPQGRINQRIRKVEKKYQPFP